MSAILPRSVQNLPFINRMAHGGLAVRSRGKVRDSFLLPEYSRYMLLVASDRISAFDVVLPWSIPDKGKVLKVLSYFWSQEVFFEEPSHLIAAGGGIDRYVGASLSGDPDLQMRSMVVRMLDMLPVECVVRGYLTGSGWKDYQKSGAVCGHVLRPGLRDGDELDVPIFTPATKAAVGHDENISAAIVREQYGEWPEAFSLHLYETAATHAWQRGIILVDTKFEFGLRGDVADEVLTPDSSRFVLLKDWEKRGEQGGMPPSYDKQPVRNAIDNIMIPESLTGGQQVKLKDIDLSDPAQCEWLEGLEAPTGMIEETAQRYREICRMITGRTLEEWEQELL